MYRIELTREAESSYRWLYKRDRALFERVDACLEELKKNPYLGKPLKGALKGDYSYRIGVYRIIYAVVQKRLVIYILDIAHRREVYRR